MVKELNSEKVVRGFEAREEETNKAPSKRDRALEFAKNVPRPVIRNVRSRTVHNGVPNQEVFDNEKGATQLEFLEFQHQMYQKKLNSIEN